jgi:nitric oxide reductase NorQ protein
MSTVSDAASLSSILFRFKQPLEGAKWVTGCEEHKHLARRNRTGSARVSAILARSLVQTINGAVLEATLGPGCVHVNSRSKSTPTTVWSSWWVSDGHESEIFIPHGSPKRLTYHLGVLGMAWALAEPSFACDLLEAYQILLDKVEEEGGLTEVCKETFCRAADELYFWVRYGPDEPEETNDRFARLQVYNAERQEPPVARDTLPAHALTDSRSLRFLRHQSGVVKEEEARKEKVEEIGVYGNFVGWQAAALEASITARENVLMAGPTGTGKTFALLEVARLNPRFDLVIVEGKEGLLDLDFLGAILPTEDDRRVWIDGPVLRAMRRAKTDPVVLFLDEINRVPRKQINLLLGLMNPKSREICEQMRIPVEGVGPFYVIEVPMTSEIVWCPTAHLRIIGSGNFGRAYAVHELDPAVRRRFDTVIEFDYLPPGQEIMLAMHKCGLPRPLAEALVSVASETRRMMGNGELPGCIDTASLLNWGHKCVRAGVRTTDAVMQQARLTWADLVCGREHTGQVNQGNFEALEDYLKALGKLPEGGEK